MQKCKSCNKKSNRLLFRCTDCGRLFCEECADKTQRICPSCYSNIDFND